MTTSLDPKTLLLLNAAKGGDEEAWQNLYDRYHGYLTYVVKMRLTGSPRRGFDAEDVLQDAFIKAWKQVDGFEYRGEGSFLSWLTRIVVNQFLNQARGSQDPEHALDTTVIKAVPEDPKETPAEAMIRAESEERLRKGFEELDAEDQMILGLRLGQGLKWEEIGDILDCRRAAASQRFVRAIERLRRLTGPPPSGP